MLVLAERLGSSQPQNTQIDFPALSNEEETRLFWLIPYIYGYVVVVVVVEYLHERWMWKFALQLISLYLDALYETTGESWKPALSGPHAVRRKQFKALSISFSHVFFNANTTENANVTKGKCFSGCYCTALYRAVLFCPALLCSVMCCFIPFCFMPFSWWVWKWGASSCVSMCVSVCLSICGAQEWSPLPQHPVT